MVAPVISVVVPVYNNAKNLPSLLETLGQLSARAEAEFDQQLEAVFVVDGSPDESYLCLATALPRVHYAAQLINLSRNFGAFAAIRAGLKAARGDTIAVLAADLQEPPNLILEFHGRLATGDYDVAVGRRIGREDPARSRLASALFWALYRRFVIPDLPAGGVDVFAISSQVRDHIVDLNESNTSLVGLLFWVGFRRAEVPYRRRAREVGVSAWTFRKKLRYLNDSVFSFSDLPIRVLLALGAIGLTIGAVFGLLILSAKILGSIPVPGYATTTLLVIVFGALNCFGLGVVGGYVWRTYENTKARPNYLIATQRTFTPPPRTLGHARGELTPAESTNRPRGDTDLTAGEGLTARDLADRTGPGS